MEDLDRLAEPKLNLTEVETMHEEAVRPLKPAAKEESDPILRDLQVIMFAYDIGILKRADRLQEACRKVAHLAEEIRAFDAPHVHELVRLMETEAMLVAAQFILGASLYRTESRLSHFREDFSDRDDANWLVWVDIEADKSATAPRFAKTPIPMPLFPVTAIPVRPNRLKQRAPIGGGRRSWCASPTVLSPAI